MNPIFLAALPLTKPGAVGIGIAASVVLYRAFKATRFVIKKLPLAALIALGLGVCWYYTAHHGSF